MRILGIETSCDETAAAVVDDGRIVRSSVVASQADLHARYGGVVPEIASRAHVELDRRRDRAGARRSGHDARRDRRGRGGARPGPRGRAARRRERGQGDRARDRRCRTSACNHHEAHIYAALLEDPTLEPPLVTLDRVGRAHAADRDGRPRRATACSARPSTTPRARRSTRSRGSSASAIPAVPRSIGSRATGDPDRDRVPAPDARRRPRLLVLGPEDRGRAVRAQASRRRGRRRRRVVPGRGRRRAGRRSCSRAARDDRASTRS